MKMTPLKAIHLHCFNCIADPQPGNGTKHEQTESCTSYQCALYELRPITSREKSRRSDEKLKAMSREELGVYEAKKALKTRRLIENLGRPKV
jgi:hypothetical protein